MDDSMASICALDDATALRVLSSIARSRLQAGAEPPPATSEVQAALKEAFPVVPPSAPLSEGDVARNALQLLAEDPPTREAILTLSQGPAPQSYDAGMAVALFTAAVIALQTYVRLERDKHGKWTVKIERKPPSEVVFKTLVQSLLGLFQK
jgi:hypothetical protein